ncbi:MAG: GNAT family N-acetyltransferase [Bacteroidota bacterium]
MDSLTIKAVTPDDVAVLYEMMVGIARYHNQEEYLVTTEEELRKAMTEQPPRLGALVAEVEGKPAGYLSYTWNYSIWKGATYLNVDDVFVWEQYRGKKVGEALMQAAKALCESRGVDSLRWEVEEDNAGAIRFYERLGAEVTVKGVCKWKIG